MASNDPYPEPIKEAVEYARDELEAGFAPDPEQFYESTERWDGATHGSKRTYSGLGVHVERDRYFDENGDEQWKVEVVMASYPSADPLLIEEDLSVDNMQDLIRAFRYRLEWFHRQGEYEPSYKRKD